MAISIRSLCGGEYSPTYKVSKVTNEKPPWHLFSRLRLMKIIMMMLMVVEMVMMPSKLLSE
jgi:hypothetical protein